MRVKSQRAIDNEQLAARAKDLAQQTGDDSLYWQLVLDNQAMIYKALRSIVGYAPDDDQLQLANLAAFEAFVKWEPERGTVWQLLRWKIMRAVNSQEGRFGIHVPISKQNEIRQSLEIERARMARGLPASIEAVCPDDDTLTFAVAFLCMNRKSDGASVHYVRQHDEVDNALEQITVEPDQENRAFDSITFDSLVPVLNAMDQRTKTIIHLRYMQEKTLGETGEVVGLSRERVRQIERRALNILRESSGCYWDESWRNSLPEDCLTIIEQRSIEHRIKSKIAEQRQAGLPVGIDEIRERRRIQKLLMYRMMATRRDDAIERERLKRLKIWRGW